jgi:hypothetical protein
MEARRDVYLSGERATICSSAGPTRSSGDAIGNPCSAAPSTLLHVWNIVVSVGKPLLPMFLCPNQSQRTTLGPRNAVVRRNLGGRPLVGRELGFHRRPCFGGPEPTQIMHVDLICVYMCDVGLGDAIARSQV